MLNLQNIAYRHPNSDILFHDINLSLKKGEKLALIAQNGRGKSTLLKIIAGDLEPSEGKRFVSENRFYLPQIYGQYNHLSVAEALLLKDKLHALNQILNGNASNEMLQILDDDWNIEERCQAAMDYWQISDIDLSQTLACLSGGQKTKIFLAALSIHEPDLILMDEPSNHLDSESRHLLYHFIQNCPSAILLVSHDRALLNHLDRIGELNKSGIHFYGGNYNFYAEQKRIENNALLSDLKSTEKALAKAKEKERDVLEWRQKLDARAKKRQVKMGTPKVMMGMLKNNAEKSRGKLLNTHSDKIAEMRDDVIKRRSELNDIDTLSFSLSNSHLHRGKILFKASELNISYHTKRLWETNLNVDIHSADRIAIKGKIGSGKSTLIKIILGRLNADAESLYRSDFRSIYLDQDYSLINTDFTVYEQVLAFNKNHLEEHELKTRLSQFLFDQLAWSKSCAALSGGEKMRLVLACLSVESTAPDLIVLDEPTNNIDLETVHILTKVVRAYKGTLLVVSHDDYFLNDLMIDRAIEL